MSNIIVKQLCDNITLPYVSMKPINPNYYEASKKLGFKKIDQYRLFFDLESVDPVSMLKNYTDSSEGDVVCVVAPFCVRMRLLYEGFKLLEFMNDYNDKKYNLPSCNGAIVHWIDFNMPTYKIIHF